MEGDRIGYKNFVTKNNDGNIFIVIPLHKGDKNVYVANFFVIIRANVPSPNLYSIVNSIAKYNDGNS